MTDKKIECRCANCGAEFSVIPSRLKHGRGLHCSTACQYAANKRPRRQVFFNCAACDRHFGLPVSKAQRKGAGKYCSRVCRDAHWVGTNTLNWQNGSGVYKRGPRWHSIRRKILKTTMCRCSATTTPLTISPVPSTRQVHEARDLRKPVRGRYRSEH